MNREDFQWVHLSVRQDPNKKKPTFYIDGRQVSEQRFKKLCQGRHLTFNCWILK